MSQAKNNLYQMMILDHNKNPRNFREIEDTDHSCQGDNPLCGDSFTISLKLDDGLIKDAAFMGQGCAISKSSASMMTEAIIGKSIDEAKGLFTLFHNMIAAPKEENADYNKLPAKLKILEGVREYPSRVKCATLSWHAMICALKEDEAVTTE